MAQREFARASIDVIQETGKRNISACERCVGALGKLNAFWQGESPCRVRSSQPPLPSVAAMKEVGLMTVWRTGENSWCWDMSGAIGGLILGVEHKKQVFYISKFYGEGQAVVAGQIPNI